MRVLIVEDDPGNRELLRRWLIEWKYEVTVADSSAAALEAMLAQPCDIMLCDIRMPGRDGLWLAERVRTKWPRTVIIMTTGAVEIEAVEKAKRIGAIDYVTKPFGQESMRQAVERAVAALEHS